ncbi:NAD(P)H oxidoreductase [Apilactobacillus ozensis DSM 23829 = JCM 17196]|uniref:NAD(P)H oxidoreductase n=2 Tax=Apilactobacillus ozensis TaxID=866801 RepID=A0A0R2AKY0_9LACO|nr:NAD(P)H oxidoreductase [Apilactobacillus ozensis DSM 23829 = JCM 17196]
MYDLYPDFNIDIETEQKKLLNADRIVLQFPMYWYSSPSLLKKWLDDVLTHGWAYGSKGNALKGKEILIAVSPGAKDEYYRRESGFGYTVNDFLRPFQATSNLIGAKFLKPFVTTGASSINDEKLSEQSKVYLKYINNENISLLGHFE